MKTRTLVAFVLLLLPAGASAQDYVEHSVGLTSPVMEEGQTEIEFGDVNGDGHVDMISVGDHGNPGFNSDEHGAIVWLGDGTGRWTMTQFGNFGYGGVALGDVNGDGLMDIGWGCHHNYTSNDLGNQILEVALGNGTGSGWSAWDDGLATNGETWGMFGTDFADVDGDGRLDVGSIAFGCCAGVHVYRNDGDGTWTQSFGFNGGNSALMFTFGDVNGDGIPDFAAAHGSGTVYLGAGAGGFTPADGTLGGGPYRRNIDLGDVDDDGRDDLVFLDSGVIRVWAWRTGNQWVDLSGDLAGYGTFDAAQLADMNIDGHGDVVVFREGSSSGSPGTVRIFAGDGAGNWTDHATVLTAANQNVAAFRVGVDVDHNGYPDIVVIQKEHVGGLPIPWRNRPRVYLENSAPRAAFVHPVRPRGGETVRAGSTVFVDWHAGVPEGMPTMTIELSSAGPAGPWQTIALDVVNSGRYQWRVPPVTVTTETAVLRFSLGTEPATTMITPGPFEIVGLDCPTDLNGDGTVGFGDVLAMLAAWGPCALCAADLDADGSAGFTDLLFVLSSWGPCS